MNRMMRIAALAAVSILGAAGAQAQTYTAKMGIATLNDVQHVWLKNYAAALEKDSGGRIKSEIYPASQLGTIPRMIEQTQFGAIQLWAGPPAAEVGGWVGATGVVSTGVEADDEGSACASTRGATAGADGRHQVRRPPNPK